jgi:hypothetical protein
MLFRDWLLVVVVTLLWHRRIFSTRLERPAKSNVRDTNNAVSQDRELSRMSRIRRPGAHNPQDPESCEVSKVRQRQIRASNTVVCANALLKFSSCHHACLDQAVHCGCGGSGASIAGHGSDSFDLFCCHITSTHTPRAACLHCNDDAMIGVLGTRHPSLTLSVCATHTIQFIRVNSSSQKESMMRSAAIHRSAQPTQVQISLC